MAARPLTSTLLGLSLALSATLALPACDDGEGTLFHITTYPPDTPGEDPLVVYHTKCAGFDDSKNPPVTFDAYVEVHGYHSKEYKPMGVGNLAVEFRMYTFNGPAFPDEAIELRSQERSTVVVAEAFGVTTGNTPFLVPNGGGTSQPANFITAGTGGMNLQRVCANRLIDVKVGTMVVQLNFDQLQGIGKYLQKITAQRTE